MNRRKWFPYSPSELFTLAVIYTTVGFLAFLFASVK